jgi:hypothetical protein
MKKRRRTSLPTRAPPFSMSPDQPRNRLSRFEDEELAIDRA